uniref:hypothetical protein n=1 Tax=Treponema zioleckii TaxID=331680 RepID=UPI00168B24D2
MSNMKKISFVALVSAMFSVFIGFLKSSVFAQSIPSSRATYYGDVPKNKRLLLSFGDQISHEAMFGPDHKENDVKNYLAHGLDPN